MAIKAAKQGDTLTLELSGVVGDGWSDNPITSKAVGRALREAGEVKVIHIKPLNSPGGYVVEGLQIYQMLVDHPARVIVEVGAQAASCGSLISMAGDEIILHESSLFLVHNPWNITLGDYVVHGKATTELQTMADIFADVYAKRSGMSKADVQKLMDEDRYMSATEAKELGLCDKLIASKKKEKDKQALTPESARAELLRARTTAMIRMQRSAAAALFSEDATNETPAPIEVPEARENTETMALSAVICAALCLAEGATEADAVTSINGFKASKEGQSKLLDSLGAKSVDDALGRIEALKGSDERAKAAEKRLADYEAESKQAKHAALIKAAMDPASGHEHAGKLSPGMKAWAEKQTTETLEGYLAVAAPLAMGDGHKPPSGGSGSKYSGKPWEEMTAEEQRALHESDPQAFEAAYADYAKRSE